MGSVRYTIVDGEVLSENRDGVKLDYVPDPLGSTISQLSNTQVQVGTASYWPYGEGSGGSGLSTRYKYVGTRGYYYDNSERTYVRARELHQVHARWMTQDPIGFSGRDWNLYRYVGDSPVTYVDPSGTLGPCRISCAFSNSRCIEITNDYADWGEYTGDVLASCASCVSKALCIAIIACKTPILAWLLPHAPFGPIVGIAVCAELLGPGQCQNQCMAQYWREQKLREWISAHKICKQFGRLSYECCAAQIHAEQRGYTLCAQKCGGGLAWWGQADRERFGLALCCTGLTKTSPSRTKPSFK